MKALGLLALITSFNVQAKVIQRICYDSIYQKPVRVMLSFDTDSKTIQELTVINEDSGAASTMNECLGRKYESEGELLNYGTGELKAECAPKKEGTYSVNYVNDYDEWKLYINSEEFKSVEWMCE